MTRLTITENIYLPKGVKDGQKIRLHSLGHASDCYTSAPGDLLLTLKVNEHPFFRRKEQTIIADLPITISQAILGADVTIETVDGPINIKVPPGS